MKNKLNINFELLPSILGLSSKYILDAYLKDFNGTNITNTKQLIYIDQHQFRYDLPDYIQKNNLEELNECNSIKNLLEYCFTSLDKQFELRENNKVYIKDSHYESWQHSLTLTLPLPIITSFLARSKNIKKNQLITEDFFQSSTLPSIYNSELENIINKDGLTEMHMHFTGTTEAQKVWLDHLQNPIDFYRDTIKTSRNNEVFEQYLQLDSNFTPNRFYNLLKKAKYIRLALIEHIKDKNKNGIFEMNWALFLNSDTYASSMLDKLSYLDASDHPYKKDYQNSNTITCESLFLVDLFSLLRNTDSIIIHKLIHIYFLIGSQMNKLLVQQLHQYGFDQFQKITINETREKIEFNYYDRFKQIEGMYDQDITVLEIRFAPKDNFIKLKRLVDRIIIDYERYYKESSKTRKPELLMVGHFIKMKDKPKTVHSILYNHHFLRRKLQASAHALLALLRSHPKYRYYIKGIDAAANELHASPEVFAPIFRYFSQHYNNSPKELVPIFRYFPQSGDDSPVYSKESILPSLPDYCKDTSRNPHLGFTYHAGEDFVHIISGVRMIYEAVDFLQMPEKSRIGHATALGISPEYWKKRIGDTIKIRRGEWLDNLIFLKMRLHNINHDISKSIDTLWKDVYNEPLKSFSIAIKAYQCRKVDPFVILGDKIKAETLNNIDKTEWNYKKILGFKPTKEVERIYKKYHTSEFNKNYNEIIPIQLDKVSNYLLTHLQNNIIQLLNEKTIAIESIPTSNIRISFYENYEDHHIFNWTTPDGNPNNLTPHVVIGSDDPGIFSNNLRTEFSQLYLAALKKGYTPETTIKWLSHLNSNAKVFTF